MSQINKWVLKFALLCCALPLAPARAQFDGELTAAKRLYPEIGAGLRALKRAANGRTYVLDNSGISVFDAHGKHLATIGEATVLGATEKRNAGGHISFGEDCDIDADGNIYVADRAANLVLIFSADGNLARSIAVNSPTAVASLSGGDIAVTTLRQPQLITVFDKQGHEIREFGELADISDNAEMNRYLNAGKLATDAQGHLYYAFVYLPEPTVRQYDRNGYAAQEIRYAELLAMPTAQAARKEIERQERKGKAPSFKPILTAVGVNRDTGEVWMALHNTLLRFDQEGNRMASYQLYTPEGARLDASSVVIDKDKILIGSDPLGVYEFERPDNKLKQ